MHSSRATLLFVVTCSPLLAQRPPDKPHVVKLASPLPVSTQSKAAEAVDIVLSLRHAPGGDAKCEKDGACEAAGHWQAEVKLGAKADAPPKTFALSDKDELKKHLEWAASPKARTKHADRVNVSDATLSLRVPAATAYPLVQGLLMTAVSAGIHRVEFAVVPAADSPEQRLPVPFPTDEGAQLTDDPAPPELRIALIVDGTTGKCLRLFGRAKLADGEAGDRELRAKLKEATAAKKLPAMIDAGAGVPWQAVVGVIDACRATGVEAQFANPDAKKK